MLEVLMHVMPRFEDLPHVYELASLVCA
jgi:hypothetical protein